ncbi:MAG: efflux RND transporter periplasmic adaptor subunit [Deltaproteobacteria bacterium]|nr:efflux RND transporter periplasmic adaptor subunit [Deltaproteobacteria bacterium]
MLREFTGNIEAKTEVQVYPKITAKIEEIKVDSGDSIKRGDVIALLESDELRAQLAQTEAALAVVQAKWSQIEVGAREEELAQAEDLVAKARANLKDAENNYGRMKALYQRGTIARRQFEAAELTYTVAKAELNSAVERLEMLREGATREERQALQAQVNQAKATLDIARIRLSYARITSPIDGTISERFLDPGNLAVPARPLVTIVQMDTVKVVVYFPEDLIRYMAPGIGAQLTVAAYPDKLFSGRIDKVSPTLNPKTRMLDAEIEVLNKGGLLRPGMFTRVSLFVDPHPDALLVPKEAVLYREEYSANAGSSKGEVHRSHYLFVADQGRARMRTIVLGHESGTTVEVCQGLKAGERVVIRGMHQLKDGDRVTVIEPEGSGA